MATRGRKPKAKEVKDFYINNEPTMNKAWQKKVNVFSSTAQFFNIFPEGKDHIYLTPVKKGERLGYGKYRIVAHYDNRKSDDRDAVLADRKTKDLFFKDKLTTPSRIKYDAFKGQYGYHLITHDRDGKRVEVPIIKPFPNDKTGNFVATVMADMNIPDASHKRSTKDRNKKGKIMSCPVNAGSLAISTSNPGKLKLTKKTPKAECSKFGNKTGFSPKEYEDGYKPPKKKGSTKDAESTEEFLSESDLIYYYSAQGIEMDLSDYVAMDSVTVDDTSYQPAQNYGAEWMAEFCAGCGNHKRAEGCGCMGAESDSATYEPSSEPEGSTPATEPTNANPNLFGADGVHHDGGRSDGGKFLSNCCDGDITTMDGKKWKCMKCNSPVEVNVEELEEWYYDAEMNAESLEDFNGMESVVVEPPLGHGVAQWYAEGDSATYEPSSEPEGSTPATEPTNANFSAESKNRWVKGKDGKTYVLRKKTGRMVTHNAESKMNNCPICKGDIHGDMSMIGEEIDYDICGDCDIYITPQGMSCIECGFGDTYGSATPCESCEPIADKMKMVNKKAESSPSSFDIRWEDVEGVSSPSLPPEGIHFAEGDSAIYEPSSEPEGSEPATEPTNENADLFGADCMNCKMAECMCAEYYDAQETLEDYTPMESVTVDDTSYQPAQNYGAEFEGEFTDSVKKGAGWGVGLALGYGLLTTGLIGIAELLGRRMNKGE